MFGIIKNNPWVVFLITTTQRFMQCCATAFDQIVCRTPFSILIPNLKVIASVSTKLRLKFFYNSMKIIYDDDDKQTGIAAFTIADAFLKRADSYLTMFFLNDERISRS